ncbi:hypothetical protein TSARBOMBA_232 [Bacillus phage TsarBomba]|uniref:Uncharacterized protein n=1 Tax=Bacillus phage TsarBomba TaxID=1690456 RepID=A0A0K2D0F0_9CAUD|nr:hypothetical protein TSARBOMBA_232 [Bacillus phage TsarBomba]ALA13071.1 hypothetical protein TSARBOMBA_232 [Bacillus phage TsarBomba]
METYVVSVGCNDIKDIKYVGDNLQAAKDSVIEYEKNVYLYVWNGGILVRKYIRITRNFGRDVQWKLVEDYLGDMKAQAAILQQKLSKINEVVTPEPMHKDDGEGGWYLA